MAVDGGPRPGTPTFHWQSIDRDPNARSVLAARARHLEATRRPPIRSRIDHLRSLAAGKVVLDVGVVEHEARMSEGDRWLHRHLVEAAERCVGVDILADDVAALVAKGYDVRVHDLSASPLDETFDVVVGGELIEHLGAPEPFLANLGRMLAPGGRVVLTTPNPYMVHRAWKHLRGGFPDSVDHVTLLGPGQVLELASRAGLALDAWRGIALKDLRGARNQVTALARKALVATVFAAEVACDSIIYELVAAGSPPADAAGPATP